MKLQSFAIAAVLASAFGTAAADTINVDLKGGPINWSTFIKEGHHVGAFTDTFTFTNYTAPSSIVSGSLVNTATTNNSISFTGASVNGVALQLWSLPDFNRSGYSFTNLGVNGPLTLVVSGIVNGNGNASAHYGGDFNVSAVPEPATYGMLVGGMAVLAFAARRRKH